MLGRMMALGLRGVKRVRLTENRSVMVSFSPRGELRVHRAYADAPDDVLRAIVQFVSPGVRRQARLAAQRVIVNYDIGPQPERRRQRRYDAAQPGDLAKSERLAGIFADLNRRHFDGALPELPLRLSGRMRTRLGQLCLDPVTLKPFEITMSRRHIDRHGWAEARHTLLHEMVHLWQHENRYPVDHGPIFRSKAREVGVIPSARRSLRTGISRLAAALFE
jgi:hypothetical protein